jgi:RNA polymerase sigma-70 factor (ECF subfamily)
LNETQYHKTDFTTVFDTHKKRVYNTVLSLLQNREEAEDVVQEVFVKVYETLPQFKGDSSLSTWIYRIAVNKSLDFLKAKKTKKRSGFIVSLFGGDKNDDFRPLDVPDFVHPGVIAENKELATTLFKAIDKLPDNQKVAFTLSKIDGLNYAEIAEVMQVSTPSVESLLFRAKQNLQKLLREYYENEVLV